MKTLTAIGASLIVALTCTPVGAGEHSATQTELAAFFDSYIAVYNQRFGHPERSPQFREALNDKVLMPIMQSPPVGAPLVPDSLESFNNGFEGFVTRLEGKGVVQLKWVSREYQVLSSNKVLANNVAVGVTQDGQVAYETASLYLVYRAEDGWKIVLFSPYDYDKAFRLGRS